MIKYDTEKGSNNIKKLRIRLGLTQVEFANELKVVQSLVSQWESGERAPSFDNCNKIIQLSRKNGIKKIDIYYLRPVIDDDN